MRSPTRGTPGRANRYIFPRSEGIVERFMVVPSEKVDENQKLTIDQRSVIAGFGVDVLVNHGTEDKALFEDAITLVVDFLLRVSANPTLIDRETRRFSEHFRSSQRISPEATPPIAISRSRAEGSIGVAAPPLLGWRRHGPFGLHQQEPEGADRQSGSRGGGRGSPRRAAAS